MVKLTTAQKATAQAARKAFATGQLTRAQFDRITDGKVTASDLKLADKLMNKADKLLSELGRLGPSQGEERLAERRLDIANALYEAIDGQLDAQADPANKPSTSSGKGSSSSGSSRRTRSGSSKGSTSSGSSGSGKGSTSRPAPSRPSRPTRTSGGKGVSRPRGK